MRDQSIASAKTNLRHWFASQPDSYLIRVVGECRSGRFEFRNSDCCIRGLCSGGYDLAISAEARAAEDALYAIGGGRKRYVNDGDYERIDVFCPEVNRLGRVRTLPIVLAEIRKRHRVPTAPPVEVACE